VEKIPFVIVVGGKEEESGAISTRRRGSKESQRVPVQNWVDSVKEEVRRRS
jgi:threonyl-tRNA synthetase